MAMLSSSNSFRDIIIGHPPARSISLPPRIHPTSVKLESGLSHLKTWPLSTEISAEAIQNGLVALAELYTCIDQEFTHSPQTQQSLSRHQNGKLVEEWLERSVTLLDTCNTARDLMLQMKQHVHALQSALRRRGASDSSMETHIAAYISFKKKAKKDITKSMAALKKLELKASCSSASVIDIDYTLSFIIKVLQEATDITISIFKSLLLFIVSMPTRKTKAAGGWSLITKLVRKRLSSPLPSSGSENKGVEKIMNEVEGVDLALHGLQGNTRTCNNNSNNGKSDEVQVAQKMLETLDVRMEGVEAGLDVVFRCLVENRVCFLNILTH